MNTISPAVISAQIAKGAFKPHVYLSNLSMAYFQQEDRFVAKNMFPICPVPLSTANYYCFDKASLLRDNVGLKPQFGKVSPAQIGLYDQTYRCLVYQYIAGNDQLTALNYQRTGAPGAVDWRRSCTKQVANQMNIHHDILFAEKFFQPGVWESEWTGGTTYDETAKTFIKFSDDNCDPVRLFDDFCTQIEQNTGRRPNRLGLGTSAFNALKSNPSIVERVKFGGSTANPASVNTLVLAALFGLEKVLVLTSVYNKAGLGNPADMQFICDPTCALLAYATNAPAIDEPSAGYIFNWDMLGDGQYMPISQFEGEPGTHSEFIEGLFATDMKKTADDLAVFLKDCV